MLRRHLGPVRGLWAAGLLCGSLLGTSALAQSAAPVPGPDAATETVEILQAQKAGDLRVTVRGQGDDRVKFLVRNTTSRRLNVVLPPGLVAASALGQPGFQSMGLGTPTTSSGSFGRFQTAADPAGFRSVPVGVNREGVAVSSGQTVEFTVPSVCLNFGIPTPTPRHQFVLMDVNDYTPDVRVRKALRSLSTLGTSQRVAQAVMWHVANGLTLNQLARQAAKQLNHHELTVAARFVEALDASGSSELVDPAYLNQARVFVRVQGDGAWYEDAKRLSSELAGQRLLGLPIHVVTSPDDVPARPSALFLNVTLTDRTTGRLTVRHAPIGSGWTRLGATTWKADGALSGSTLTDAVDRAVASTFVTAKVARRSVGSTTLRIENRLPLTVAHVTLRAGKTTDAGTVQLDGLGVGPARAALATIPAANGRVERVELNGL